VPEIVIPSQYLRAMGLEQLQEIASQVGIGYAGLGEAALREKLILEGTPED